MSLWTSRHSQVCSIPTMIKWAVRWGESAWQVLLVRGEFCQFSGAHNNADMCSHSTWRLIILVICAETAVLAPLETLNTNLNYKILDDFIGKMTGSTFKFLSTNPSTVSSPAPVPDGSCASLIYPNDVRLSFSVSANRFSVETVDASIGLYHNDKKGRMSFVKLPPYSINTINELPERTMDEER